MGGRSRSATLTIAFLSLLSACADDRYPRGSRCSAGTQCQTGLCLERSTGEAVCVSRCSADGDCSATEVCGRFDFRGRDDAGLPAGKDTDVVRVCRVPLQARCEGTCSAGEQCLGVSESVCVPRCHDRLDCGGRDCVNKTCDGGPGYCAPACDSVRDCPRFFVCDTAFLGTDGHGRCLPVTSGADDAGLLGDALCVNSP
jgi:hypothetical protein